MSTPCRPCEELVCVPPNDLTQYGLDGFPPQPLPPVVPPVPPAYGNDALEWCCEEGTPSWSGDTPLPGWLTIQEDCLVVTRNAFRASTKAAANEAAQAALDAFVAAGLESGDLECTTCTVCSRGIEPALEDTYTTTAFMSFISYADSVRKLFLSSNDYNIDVEVRDAQTGNLLDTIPEANANSYGASIIYNPSTGKIYESYGDDDAGEARIRIINPDTLVVEDTITMVGFYVFSLNLGAVDSANNRIYYVGDTNGRIGYLDCSNNTWVDLGILFAGSLNFIIYAPNKSSIYLSNAAGQIRELNTSSNTIVFTDSFLSLPWEQIRWPFYFSDDGMIYFTQSQGGGPGRLLKFNPLTNTVDAIIDMLALTGNLFSPTGQPTINDCTDLALLTSGSGIMIYFDPISVSVQTIDVSANPDQRDGVYAACEKRSFFTDTGNNNLYKFT